MSLLARTLAALIGLYSRYLSPLLPAHCRYYPSCSHYAAEAIRTHGGLKGSLMAARRIARCHPWASGGVDRVPAKEGS